MNDEPQRKPPGRPFTGNDSRINRLGRPKHFDQVRKLAQRISHEKVIGADGNTITRAEQLLRTWAKSRVPALQIAFAAYCWGKPPEKIEVDELQHKPILILHHGHELDRIESLRRGSQSPGDDNGTTLRLKCP